MEKYGNQFLLFGGARDIPQLHAGTPGRLGVGAGAIYKGGKAERPWSYDYVEKLADSSSPLEGLSCRGANATELAAVLLAQV